MNEQALRMTDADHPDSRGTRGMAREQCVFFLGTVFPLYWETYPGVFSPEWLFAGRSTAGP
jgi:hypothetical protein